MQPIYEEHDALIVAAALGILKRVEDETSARALAATGAEARDLTRTSEASRAAGSAVFHALSVAGNYGECPEAAAVIARHLDRGPEPAPVPA